MSDVYKIGVAIALNSNGLGVLGALAGGLKGLDRAAVAATGRMNALKVAALGAFGVFAGVSALKGLSHLVDKGAELIHQQSLLRRAGLDNVQVADATARAWTVAGEVRGAKVSDVLKSFGELRTQVSSDKQALDLLPDVTRIGVLLENATGKKQSGLAQTVMRVIEGRGQIFDANHQVDMAKVRNEMTLMYQAMSASHGLVTPQTFMNFQQQAGPAGMALSPETFYGMMPTAMQTMGGHRAGTAMASLFAQFMGGIMTQRTATALQDVGMLDASKTHIRRGGQVTLDADAFAGKFDASNPFTFVTALKTAIEAKGGNAAAALESVLDPKIVQGLYRTLGREPTRRLVAEMISLAPVFERDFRLRQQNMTPEAAANEARSDPKLASQSLKAAIDNLMTALGSPLVPSSVSALNALTDAVNRVTAWAVLNPDTVRSVGMALAGVAGLFIAGGVLAIGGAALSAMGVLMGPLGLLGLGLAIVALRDVMPGLYTRTGAKDQADGITPSERMRGGVDTSASGAVRGLAEQIPGILVKVLRETVVLLLDVGAELARYGMKLGADFRVIVDREFIKLRAFISEQFGSVVTAVQTGLSNVSNAIIAWVTGLAGRIGAAFTGSGSPEITQKALEDGARRMQGRGGLGNTGPGSGLFQPQSYAPPPANSNARTTPIHMIIDGRKFGEVLFPHVTRAVARPSQGQTGYDTRMAPSYGQALYSA